jgi:hypothetical protein
VALQKSLATLADRLFSAVHSTELKTSKKTITIKNDLSQNLVYQPLM